MTMGNRLRQLRLKRSISQEEVAKHIGITRSAYSHYEINNRQPVYETLLKLASFYDVSLDYIIGRDTSDKPGVPEDTVEIINFLNTLDNSERKTKIDMMMSVIKNKN